MKNYIYILLSSLLFISCDGFKEEIFDIDVDVDNMESVLVINAEIEKDSTVWVQISYSEDINSHIDTPVNYEENAIVTLETKNGEFEVLNYYDKGFYYGKSIRGKVEETYTLKIEIKEELYIASSYMYPPRGYDGFWITIKEKDPNGNGKTGSIVGYSDEWKINDPSNERNRYLFEWWVNGVHYVRQDWCIDDNRVVNANEGLTLFTVTLDPQANEHIRHRTAEVDKSTYDYFNMYEKIVRGMVSASSQTPYNPASNFGKNTIGNFRAVAFSSAVLLTPPNITATGSSGQINISFPGNKLFSKYNLYWSFEAGVSKNSEVIKDIVKASNGKGDLNYIHKNLNEGDTYYYKIEVEDSEGNISVLSPEVSAVADSPSGNSDNKKIPQNVTVTAGTGEIIIEWDEAEDKGDDYLIYWKNKPGIIGDSKTENMIISSNKSAPLISPYTHSGLDKNLTYYYRVATLIGKNVYLSEEVSAIPK